MRKKLKFVYPDKKIIEASKATTNSYCNPIIGFVFWNRYKTAFNFLKQHKQRYSTILEIGVFYGYFLPTLCQIADKVIGTDIESTFNFCKDKTLNLIKQDHSNLVLDIADATKLSETVETKSCDAIIAFSVLEHIEEKEKVLEEISKCLGPEGIFICELPTENWIYKMGRKIIRYSDAHENYDYYATEKLIKQYFIEKKMMNSPLGLPLYKIRVFTPNR